MPKEVGLAGAHPLDPGGMARLDFSERHHVSHGHAAVNRGYGVPVGIHPRIPQRVGHSLNQVVGDGMLQALGLVMHRVPGVAQVRYQVGLDEAVTAQHPERHALAIGRQLDSSIAFVLQKTLLREPLDHPAD